MTTVGDNSLVLSIKDTDTVFRIDINSGEMLWTSIGINAPEGVVCYNRRYILVANTNADTRIWILDSEAGW